MENEILDLWPTSILKKTFDEHNDCKKDLISFINNYKKDFPNGRSGNENKDLYESNYDIFSFAENFSSLSKLIKFTGNGFKQIASHANREAWVNQNINPSEITLKIKSMWFIDYLKDGFVFPHIHSGSWSMVYYFDLGSNEIDLSKGGTHFISPHNKSDSNDVGNTYSRESSRNIIGKEGEALFFPSTLVHSSYPSFSDQKRVIFSANAFFEKIK